MSTLKNNSNKTNDIKKDLKSTKNSVNLFKIFIDSTIEGLIISDEDGFCIDTNKVSPLLFGYEYGEMVGKNSLDFVAPQSYELVKKMMKNSSQEPYEAFVKRKDGSIFPAIVRGRDLMLESKKIRVSAILDISDIKKNEEKILKLAHYDILTELPNRILLKDYIQKALKQSSKTFHYGALLCIDIDYFKSINDLAGHEIGDTVLVEASKRIKKSIRQNDIAARLGGDEFAILIDTYKTNKREALCNLEVIVKKILFELQKPYIVSQYDFHLSASIGIAFFNNDNHCADELMKYADSAMYNAKSNGRNTFNFFDPKLQSLIEEKIKLINDLRKAIKEHAFHLNYQPQISSDTKIVGVEALVRWKHPESGMISPAAFIPAAEESGLIVPLGEWILEEAVKQIKLWETDAVKKHWHISVNISYRQFEKDDFTQSAQKILEKHSVKAEMLRLELTESLLIKNTSEALNKLHKLKQMGFSISIDDFGTGYSSLSYLKELPIDELKIDQSFIRDLTIDPNDEIITQTIISIGKKFGLEVIAEGVETQEQYEKLLGMGCQYFQGYLFAKPTTPDLL